MDDFVNTIDLLGDEAVAKSFVERTITEFHDDVITKVGYSAFHDCTNLTSVDLPKVASVDSYAFYNCYLLETANMPLAAPSRTSVNNIFRNCRALKHMSLPLFSKVYSSTFNGCSSLESVDMPNATEVEGDGFNGCIKLASVNLSKELTKVDGSAFYNCRALASIDTSNVTSIGYGAFDGCNSLTSANFPKATSIGSSAFNYCTSLTSAYFPLAEKSIGTFQGCSSLTDVYFPIATEATNGALYGCTSLAFVDFPKMTKIANQVFYGCVSLKTVVLRSTKLCSLSNTNAFFGTSNYTGTHFTSGGTGGTLLVPRALTTEYPNATNWSVVISWNAKNRVLALEDYTVDGTITGEIDWDKLNGGTT
jgi:hypothetical protein